MLIKEIVNYDNESQEADVIVSDNKFELLCYAHPFTADETGALNTPLLAFITENVMRTMENEHRIEKLTSGYYAYRLQGKVIDLRKRYVTVGNIVIQLENVIPNDITEGEFVEFSVMRIDL